MNGPTRKLDKKQQDSWKLMKMKTQLFKIFGIQQKQSWEGNTSQYKHPSKNWRKLKIHKLNLHPKEPEKEQQIKPTPSRRREIINIWAELNEIETRRTVEQINKTRSWFFERINKIDKPLASLIEKKRKKTQINKIMNERGEITNNTRKYEKF